MQSVKFHRENVIWDIIIFNQFYQFMILNPASCVVNLKPRINYFFEKKVWTFLKRSAQKNIAVSEKGSVLRIKFIIYIFFLDSLFCSGSTHFHGSTKLNF